MKLMWFHLMPYTELPDDFKDKHPSVWIDIDPALFDPRRGHQMYNDFIGASGHDELDTIFDWLLATRDVLLAAGLEGADLMAVSVSGALAADVAGVWPGLVRKLVLLAPFGLFTPADPPVDIWSQRPGHLSGLLCGGRPARWNASSRCGRYSSSERGRTAI